MGEKVMLDIYTNLDLDVLGKIGWKENGQPINQTWWGSRFSTVIVTEIYSEKKNLTFTASVCIWKSLSLNFSSKTVTLYLSQKVSTHFLTFTWLQQSMPLGHFEFSVP